MSTEGKLIQTCTLTLVRWANWRVSFDRVTSSASDVVLPAGESNISGCGSWEGEGWFITTLPSLLIIVVVFSLALPYLGEKIAKLL